MSDLVLKHLRIWATADFVWGRSDCSIVLADYVLDVTGIDGAAHLRGEYHDERSCRRLIQHDLLGAVQRCADVVGLSQTAQPVRGDIGIIIAGKHRVGALCLGDARWAVKSTDGLLTLTNPEVVAAWAVRG